MCLVSEASEFRNHRIRGNFRPGYEYLAQIQCMNPARNLLPPSLRIHGFGNADAKTSFGVFASGASSDVRCIDQRNERHTRQRGQDSLSKGDAEGTPRQTWPLVPDDSLRTELEIKNTLGCVRAWATVCVVGWGVACKVQGWVVTALGGFSKT